MDKMRRFEVVALVVDDDYLPAPTSEAGTTTMGNSAHEGPRRLSTSELHGFARTLELSWPSDGVVKGFSWPGTSAEKRNYQVTLGARGQSPLNRTWVAERCGNVYRLVARPADADELQQLLDTLRELGALELGSEDAIAEAQYDCRNRTYELSFTPLEEMLEGQRYERWMFRRHLDGRPWSVGYVFETRRGNASELLPGGSVLRGNPWRDRHDLP